jgi:hypothetical protein
VIFKTTVASAVPTAHMKKATNITKLKQHMALASSGKTKYIPVVIHNPLQA